MAPSTDYWMDDLPNEVRAVGFATKVAISDAEQAEIADEVRDMPGKAIANIVAALIRRGKLPASFAT